MTKVKEGQVYCPIYGASVYKVVATGKEYVTLQGMRKGSEGVFTTTTYDLLSEFWERDKDRESK